MRVLGKKTRYRETERGYVDLRPQHSLDEEPDRHNPTCLSGSTSLIQTLNQDGIIPIQSDLHNVTIREQVSERFWNVSKA